MGILNGASQRLARALVKSLGASEPNRSPGLRGKGRTRRQVHLRPLAGDVLSSGLGEGRREAISGLCPIWGILLKAWTVGIVGSDLVMIEGGSLG